MIVKKLTKCKAIYVVASEELNRKLKKVKANVSYRYYEITHKHITLCFMGITIKELEIKTRFKIRCDYLYNLFIFENDTAMNEYRKNGATQALKLINKYVDIPREPYCEKATRKSDMLTNNIYFKPNVPYTGHFTKFDMNSSEPYFLSELIPSLKAPILELYKKRKYDKYAKTTLVSINGHLRNTHISIYNKVNELLYNEVMRVSKEVFEFSQRTIIPFAVRRDAVIFYSTTEFRPEEIAHIAAINIGNELGQWKFDKEYGTANTFENGLNYHTNMKKIESKHTGTHIASNKAFNDITCIFNAWENKTFEIKE